MTSPFDLAGALRAATIAALLVTVVAIGTLLRIWRIDAVGFNSDEAVYAGQAAAIADHEGLKPFFPIFRAHPLLFQSTLSLVFMFGGSDEASRLLSAALGIATLGVIYLVGQHLYGRRAGVLAALFMAVMPYHVIVTRQVLLDGPMVFCSALTLYTFVRFVKSTDARWLYATGAMLGLTVLAKETSILLAASMGVFLILMPSIHVRLRDVAVSLAIMGMVIAPFPLAVTIAGRAETGGNYLVWQLFRRPNHGYAFYAVHVPEAIGPLLIITAIAGLWLLRRHNSWRELLLGSWIAVPVVFFELWPVKGYQYLLPAALPLALMAARTCAMSARWRIGATASGALGMALAAAIAISMALPAWNLIQPTRSDTFLAGSGGVPGGREAGLWLRANSPEGAHVLTIGPSMANLMQYYGRRKSWGLAVSPNPLHRNPSYEAISNPDLEIRYGELQYIVWDAFSAGRSPFFASKVLAYAERYHGRKVHTETITVRTSGGQTVEKEIIAIYVVRP